MKHRGGWLALLALLLLLILPAYAEDVRVEASAAAREDAAPAGGTALDGFGTDGDAWMSGTNVASVTVHERGGARYLSASPVPHPAGHDYTVMRMYGEGEELNLAEYAAITFSVYVPGGETEEYAIRLTVYSGLNTLYTETAVTGGSWYDITADIGDWQLRAYINMFEITVSDTAGAGVSSFAVGGVRAHGEADTAVADAFLTFGLQAEGGTAEYRDGVYYLDAGADGLLTLAADAVRPAYTAGSGVSVVRIVLDSALEGGYVSLAVSDTSVSSSSFTIASTAALYYGENTYLLPYDSDIALHAYRLSFRGLYPDGTSAVALRSVSLETFAEDVDGYAGRVTQCALSADGLTLTFTGTLSTEAAAENIDARLELYEIPVWETADAVLRRGEPAASLKMSTKFTFTLDLTGRESAAETSRYQAYIVSGAGAVPLAAAVFPARDAKASESGLSPVGLYGADSAGVFESNASSVILDVYVDRLLAPDGGGGRLAVRGGQRYYLDHTYLRELEEEIAFYVSADVEVYLRLLCASDLSAEGYTFSCVGARYFAFNVRREEGANMLCAVVGYLASRNSGVSGFIVGGRLDTARENGADMSDVAAYASILADTLRLVYNSAVRYIPGVYVLAPLGHYDGETAYSGAENGEAAGAACDPTLLSVMLSRALMRDGELPWGLFYMSDSAAEALGHAQNILAQMKAVGCRAPHDYLLFWEPSAGAADILLAEYAERCAAARRAGARVLFLSLSRQTERAAITSGMKYILTGGDYQRQLSEYKAQLNAGGAYTGSYVLSDFSRAYSTLGWIAGSGCSRLGSQSSGMTAGARTLHAVFESGTDAMFGAVSGNILCVSGRTDDLHYAPYVVYTMQITSQLESTSEAELVFVFGSGDTRAEYSATVPTGVPLEILCDLSSFAGAERVDFAAITVRSASSVTLDIERITCYSRQSSSEELARLYRSRTAGTDASAPEAEWNEWQRMLLGILILGSVMALALLSRRRGGAQ